MQTTRRYHLLLTTLFIALIAVGCGAKDNDYDVAVIDDEHFADGPGNAMATVEVITDLPARPIPETPLPTNIDSDFLIGGSRSYELQPATQKPEISFERKIQTALKNAGYYDGEIHGVIDNNSRDAIRNFQKAHNLGSDGIVGKRTWKTLSKYFYSTE